MLKPCPPPPPALQLLDLDATLLESEHLPVQPLGWCVLQGIWELAPGLLHLGCPPSHPARQPSPSLPPAPRIHPTPPFPLPRRRDDLPWQAVPLTQEPSGQAVTGHICRLPDEPHHAESVHGASWVWKGAAHNYRVRQRLGWAHLRDLLIQVRRAEQGGGGCLSVLT